ncbi:MAG: hypothetical protein ACKO2Z_18775 [Sphaerospermopsis kisseleviana]
MEIFFGGFDSQVHDSWIVILNQTGDTELLLQLPLIKLKEYGNSMIDICAVMDELRKFPKIILVAEKVRSSNNQDNAKFKGAKSIQTFGSCLNLIAQMQSEPNIDIVSLEVQTWKKPFGLDSNKKKSVLTALNMGLVIPDNGWLNKKDGTKEASDNLAESYLLAQYARLAMISEPKITKKTTKK